MTGRRKDLIWDSFVRTEPSKGSVRAKCKICTVEMVGLVARMKTHLDKCLLKNRNFDKHRSDTSASEDEDMNIRSRSISSASTSISDSGSALPDDPDEASKKKQRTSRTGLESFLVRTSVATKNMLNMQVARFIYGTNSSFRHVEHPEFIKMVEILRPGYRPPNRRQVGNELLDEVHSRVEKNIKANLRGKIVCMAIDGWSNIHNEPVVCVSVSDVVEESVHLLHSIDTTDNSHTSDYLLDIAVNAIKSCEGFQCTVRSFVTDNAANMAKMREQLARSEALETADVITYGCSAHLLNLLAHDIAVPGVKDHVKQIMKYFRHSHFASAKYKQAGGKCLVLPQDVRWNSLADCLESYLENWHVLSKVCTANKVAIDTGISSKVYDIEMKVCIENHLKKLKEISIALDKIQQDTCTIGEATEIWINLRRYFKEESEEELNENQELSHCIKRFEMAMTPAHYLANLLDPRFCGKQLNQEQIDSAMGFILSYHDSVLSEVLSYQARVAPFREYLFNKNAVQALKPVTWWLALSSNISPEMLDLVKQLHSAIASSAGIERLFSSFGLIHSKTRNRLGIQKSSKLVTIFKALNSGNTS